MTWLFFAGFVAGDLIGLITAAIILGCMDEISEWRKRRHEKKSGTPTLGGIIFMAPRRPMALLSTVRAT